MPRTVRLAAVALILAAALAGCAQPAPAPTTPPPIPTPPPFVLRNSVLSSSSGFGEPSLGVTPAGVLFSDVGSDVYASTDDGANWTDTGNHQRPVPNEDPDLAVDADGNVWEARLYVACVAVAVSRDAGKTWTSNPAVCPGSGLDRAWIIPTKGGTAYVYAHQLGSFQQLAVKTTDYGMTWIPTTPPEGLQPHFLLVNGGTGWGGGGFWNAKSGSVWFTFTYDSGVSGGATQAGYSVTRDAGATWELAGASQLEGSALGLGLVTGAADDAGNVYVVWGEATGANNEQVHIYMATSRDDGKTWAPKVQVDSGDGSKVFPEVVAGAEGRVAVAYYEGSQKAYPDNMKGTWNVTLAYTHDALADNVTFSHETLAPLVKKGPICISGTACTANREFDDYFGIARIPDGRVAVVHNLVTKDGALRNGFAVTSGDVVGPLPAPKA